MFQQTGHNKKIFFVGEPLHTGDTVEVIDPTSSDNKTTHSKFNLKEGCGNASHFNSCAIFKHSSIKADGILLSYKAEGILRKAQDLNKLGLDFTWSAKSWVGDQEHEHKFDYWLSEINKGLMQRLQLPGGIHRAGGSTKVKNLKKLLNGKPNNIYASHPSTWLSPKRESLRKSLAQAFKLKVNEVKVNVDEATAGAIGWFAERLGNEMDPLSLYGFLSEDTLFVKTDPEQDYATRKKQLALHIADTPLHFLVIDSGAGTTDIAVLEMAFNRSTERLEVSTIGKQGFIAGGLEISRELSSRWKQALCEAYRDFDLGDEIQQIVSTLVEKDALDELPPHVQNRRKELLVHFYNAAETMKRQFTTDNEDEFSIENDIAQIHYLITENAVDEISLETTSACFETDENLLNLVCATILGPSFISAADLPIQCGLTKLSGIFMIGRTLRLPNLTESFQNCVLEQSHEMKRQRPSEDWSRLLPDPHAIYSWSQDRLLSQKFSTPSDLDENIDKNCVVSGLAVIHKAAEGGIAEFEFVPMDERLQQRFIGYGNQEANVWQNDLVSGAKPGQRPKKYPADAPFPEFDTIMLGSSKNVSLFWNNQGQGNGLRKSITTQNRVYPVKAEPIYKLGEISFNILKPTIDIKEYWFKFILIEDGRVAIQSVAVIKTNQDQDVNYTNAPKSDFTNTLNQIIKIGSEVEIIYKEIAHDPDYRNTGRISPEVDIYS